MPPLSKECIQALKELLNQTNKFLELFKITQSEKHKENAAILVRIRAKIVPVLSSASIPPSGEDDNNKCKEAPEGVPCIVYLNNKINWEIFRANPLNLKEVLRVKRPILNKHIAEFDAFLYRFYQIEVYENQSGVHFSTPAKTYTYDPFLGDNEYVISKKGDIQRTQTETLDDMYVVQEKKDDTPIPIPKIFKRSELDEDKLKEISDRFDRGMIQVEDRILGYIPSQITTPVDIEIINAVIEVANEYIKLYDSFLEKNGYEEVLERNKTTYEEIKKQLDEEGDLARIKKLAEEYLPRSENHKKTDVNQNPEVLEKHEDTTVFDESEIKELYKKGKGDSDELNPNDIQQGQIGDCFFLSTLAALARNMPDDLKKLIEDNKDGTYTVTLYLREDRKSEKRTAKKIIVKPDFVEDKEGNLVYAKEGDGELWVMILEKAYAQAMGGFENIHFGFMHEAMAALTNKNPNGYSCEKLEAEEILEKLQKAIDNKAPVTISSRGQGEEKEYLDKKRFVVTGHLYSLEKIVKGQIYLQNPWGKDHLQLSVEELKKYFDDFIILE